MSTANKLTYLNGTKQAIKQAINEDFEVIDNNTTFREYAEEISSNNAKYKDLIPKETKNATNTLDISNSSGLDKALVTKYGNTYQETTTGKNLLYLLNGTKTNNGITGVWNNGILIYSGEATNTYAGITGITNTSLPAGTYTFSIDHAVDIQVRFRYLEVTNKDVIIQPGNTSATFTLTESTKRMYVFLNVLTVDSNYSDTLKIQLEKGTTATDWEKYSGGNPAPNPDYPQEIQVVTGDNEIKVQNKNLTLKNVKGYFGSNSILIDNGSESFVFYATQGETYTFSSQTAMNRGQYAKVETLNIVNNTPISNKTSISVASSYNSATFTCSFTGYCIVYVNSTANNAIAETFQIEVGTTSTTYVEHKGYTKEINLGDIELCKIVNYKDRIYPLNGKWYLEKKIGKVVLNGSESWSASRTTTPYVYGLSIITDYLKTNENICKSNYFESTINGGYGVMTDNQIKFRYASDSNYALYICTTIASTSANFKTWLSTHNTTVYYVLATPTTTEITENNYPTLYNQLNNIKLYEGVNHITMTNESGLDVEFDITYYKDWKLD